MPLPKELNDEMMAAVDLIGRTGAKFFEFGYLDEDVPIAEARWYAHAQYNGTRIMVQNKNHPLTAIFELARTLLTGAQCQGCRKLIALGPYGAYAFKSARLLDGTEWTWKDARRTGQCIWERRGAKWYSGCGLTSDGKQGNGSSGSDTSGSQQDPTPPDSSTST